MVRVSLAFATVFILMAGLVSIASPTEAEYNPGWGTATLLEFENQGFAEYECIAADAEGNAIAVWHQDDGLNTSVWAARYAIGDGWGPRERLDDGTQNSVFPSIAVDGEGNAIAVWIQYESDYHASVWSNRYILEIGWGVSELIETGAEIAGMPVVSCAGDGNATALWAQSDGVRYNMWSNRYVVGDGWQTAVMIEANDAGNAESYQAVCIDDDGNAVAVWSQDNGVDSDLWSNIYEIGTGWGTAELMESSTGDARYPSLGMDGAGNVIAVWNQNFDAWWNRYVAGSGWGIASRLEADPVAISDDARVAVTEGGDAMVVWSEFDGAIWSVVSKRYLSGVGWGPAQLVETDDSGHAVCPDVVMDEDGTTAVAVWSQWDGLHFNVKSSIYEEGVGWGPDELIESESGGNTFGDFIIPQIVMAGTGAAFAIWHQNDGYVENVWSNRFEPYDSTPPTLTISSPSEGVIVETQAIAVSGTTEPGVSLKVGGILVAVDSYGWFSCTINLVEGANNIVVIATDEAGNWVVATRSVTYVSPLSALNDDIDELQGQLDNASSNLSDMADETAELREELDSANDDVAGLGLQNLFLMVALVAVIALTGILMAAYMGLRKKVTRMEGGGKSGGGGS